MRQFDGELIPISSLKLMLDVHCVIPLQAYLRGPKIQLT